MMTRLEIQGKLLEIFEKQTKCSARVLLSGQPLADLIDSIEILEIMFDVEQAFDLEINDQQAKEMRTFEDVLVGVETLVRERAASPGDSGTPAKA